MSAAEDALTIMLLCITFVLSLGLGSTLSLATFKRAVTPPKGIITGWICQFILNPIMGFCLALALDLDGAVALSVLIVSACPGGALSNLFTYWSHGDLALSIAMTVVSTICALFMLPANLAIYAPYFLDSDVDLPYENFIIVLVIVVGASALGLYTRRKSVKWALRLEKAGSIAGIVFIFVAIIFGSIVQNEFFNSSWKIWLASAVLMLFGCSAGYSVSRFVFRVPREQSRTIAIETGVQNAAVAIAIIQVSYNDDDDEEFRDDALAFPLLYALWLVVNGLIVVAIFRYWLVTPEEAAAVRARRAQDDEHQASLQSAASVEKNTIVEIQLESGDNLTAEE